MALPLMAVFQKCCRQWYSLKREKCSKCGQILAAKKKKTFAVDIYRGGVRERIVTGSNKTEAIRYDERVRVRVREESRDPSPRPIPFKRLAEMYLERLTGRTSARDVRYIFNRLVAEWGALRTDHITPSVIETLRTKMLAEGKSQRTVDAHTEMCRAAYNVAHLPNPFKKIRQFRPDTRVVRFLSEKERKALMSALQHSPLYLQEMVLVSMETGLRQRQVFRLRRDEVDFDKEVIVLRQKMGRLQILPMSPRVVEVLKDIPENGTAYFWISTRTGKPFVKLQKGWTSLKRRAGITRNWRWHDLRHDFLSRIVTATGSLRIAQELAGHSSPQMTMRYAHLVDDSLREAVNQISDLQVTHQKIRTKRHLKSVR